MNDNSTNSHDQIVRLLEEQGHGPLITPQEAARFLRMTPAGVRYALMTGRMKGVRLSSNKGHWRMTLSQIADFVFPSNEN